MACGPRLILRLVESLQKIKQIQIRMQDLLLAVESFIAVSSSASSASASASASVGLDGTKWSHRT